MTNLPLWYLTQCWHLVSVKAVDWLYLEYDCCQCWSKESALILGQRTVISSLELHLKVFLQPPSANRCPFSEFSWLAAEMIPTPLSTSCNYIGVPHVWNFVLLEGLSVTLFYISTVQMLLQTICVHLPDVYVEVYSSKYRYIRGLWKVIERSLVGFRLYGCRESDTTEAT